MPARCAVAQGSVASARHLGRAGPARAPRRRSGRSSRARVRRRHVAVGVASARGILAARALAGAAAKALESASHGHPHAATSIPSEELARRVRRERELRRGAALPLPGEPRRRGRRVARVTSASASASRNRSRRPAHRPRLPAPRPRPRHAARPPRSSGERRADPRRRRCGSPRTWRRASASRRRRRSARFRSSSLDENRRLINDYRAASEQSQGLLHAPRLLGRDPGAQGLPRHERRLRRLERRAGARAPRRRSGSASRWTSPKADGSRTLLVPNVKGAEAMTLRASSPPRPTTSSARARTGKLKVSDFEGTTVSLTNPGTLGTTASVPRLMPGQGAIIATGAIEYPAEFSRDGAGDALAPGDLARSSTFTSTYDHRIIQGAESGAFLARVEELLLGEHGFYEERLRGPRRSRSSRSAGRSTGTRRSSPTATPTRSPSRRGCSS